MSGALALCPHCGFDLRAAEPVTDGPWHYDPTVGAFYDGRLLILGPSRTLILGALIRAGGKGVSRDALLGIVGTEDAESNIINQQVCNLRRLLREQGAPAPIETIWGRGFRWNRAENDTAQDHPSTPSVSA